MVDTVSGETSKRGAWLGGAVTGLYPSPDGTRLAVTYTNNILRVYRTEAWQEEKWSGLAGRAVGLAWAPSGKVREGRRERRRTVLAWQALLFCTEASTAVYVLRFVRQAAGGREAVMAAATQAEGSGVQ